MIYNDGAGKYNEKEWIQIIKICSNINAGGDDFRKDKYGVLSIYWYMVIMAGKNEWLNIMDFAKLKMLSIW